MSRERRHTTDYPGQCFGLRSQERQNVGVRLPGGTLTIPRRHSERRRDRLHTGVGYTHMARMREMARMITFRLPVQNGAGGFVTSELQWCLEERATFGYNPRQTYLVVDKGDAVIKSMCAIRTSSCT